jgi:hypothetical protein
MTDNFSHTPGPWSVVETKGGARIVDDADYTVAKIPWELHDIFDPTSTADALLIAAAPDMLSALEAVIEESKSPYLRARARAAIAKAKGEESDD